MSELCPECKGKKYIIDLYHVLCDNCDGNSFISKYHCCYCNDRGRIMKHIKMKCYYCRGKGYPNFPPMGKFKDLNNTNSYW